MRPGGDTLPSSANKFRRGAPADGVAPFGLVAIGDPQRGQWDQRTWELGTMELPQSAQSTGPSPASGGVRPCPAREPPSGLLRREEARSRALLDIPLPPPHTLPSPHIRPRSDRPDAFRVNFACLEIRPRAAAGGEFFGKRKAYVSTPHCGPRSVALISTDRENTRENRPLRYRAFGFSERGRTSAAARFACDEQHINHRADPIDWPRNPPTAGDPTAAEIVRFLSSRFTGIFTHRSIA